MTQSERSTYLLRCSPNHVHVSVTKHGWYPVFMIVQFFDPHYRFYVNTQANPPVTTWNHPLGPVPSPSLPEPPRRYTPPVAAPESYPGRYADGGQGGYPNQNSYPQQPPLGGYGGAEYPQRTERGLGRY